MSFVIVMCKQAGVRATAGGDCKVRMSGFARCRFLWFFLLDKQKKEQTINKNEADEIPPNETLESE